MIRIMVLALFRSRDTEYHPGQVLEVDEQRARFLLTDAPGCFERIIDKSIEQAPIDKMVRRAKAKK